MGKVRDAPYPRASIVSYQTNYVADTINSPFLNVFGNKTIVNVSLTCVCDLICPIR